MHDIMEGAVAGTFTLDGKLLSAHPLHSIPDISLWLAAELEGATRAEIMVDAFQILLEQADYSSTDNVVDFAESLLVASNAPAREFREQTLERLDPARHPVDVRPAVAQQL